LIDFGVDFGCQKGPKKAPKMDPKSIKIRNQNSMQKKMPLGGLLGRLWCHLGSPLGVKNINFPLGFSLFFENRPFRRQEGSEDEFGTIWVPFWCPKGVPNDPKWSPKTTPKIGPNFDPILRPFWAPRGCSKSRGDRGGTSRTAVGERLRACPSLLTTSVDDFQTVSAKLTVEDSS